MAGGTDSRGTCLAVVDRCQVLAGVAQLNSLTDALPRATHFICDFPELTDVRAVHLLRALLTQIAGEFVRRVSLNSDPEAARLITSLAGAPSEPRSVLEAFERIIDACSHALSCADDRRVSRALELISARYSESALNLSAVANEINISPAHLCRLFSRCTGHGFVFHLHQARLRAAADLLAGSFLTVKQIGAAVGYTSTALMDRHFHKVFGVTPSLFRARRGSHLSNR